MDAFDTSTPDISTPDINMLDINMLDTNMLDADAFGADVLDPAGRTAASVRELTVAVIHYQTPEVLTECLRRVRAAVPGARVLVIDTGDERPLASDWREADAELVRIASHSYSHAVNVALRACETSFLAFMNADAFVRPETFANLLYAMRDVRVAAAGPLIRDAEGRLQDQGLPYRVHQLAIAMRRPWVDVPWLSGCLQVVRVEAARAVGGMDASLRFYNEDLEWGWRLKEAGWRCRLVATPAIHLGGTATPLQNDAFLVEGFRGGFVLSQRYLPRWYRAAHRHAVMLWAALQERFGDERTRRAHRAVRAMFARKRFSETPFGATLADEAPGFWDEMK